MKQRLACITLGILGLSSPSAYGQTFAGESRVPIVKPDFRVRFETVPPVAPTLAAPTVAAATATARRGGLGRRDYEVFAYLGVTNYGSGSVVDNGCDEAEHILEDLYTSSGCSGKGGNATISFGAGVNYRYRITDKYGLMFQGNWVRSGRNTIQLDIEASEPPPVDFQLEIHGGVRFTTNTFGGSAGFEYGQFYVGVNVGVVKPSMTEFLRDMVTFRTNVLEQNSFEEDRNESAMLWGIKGAFEFRPGYRFVVDFNRWGFDNLYEVLQEEYPDSIARMRVSISRFSAGLAVDVMQFVK